MFVLFASLASFLLRDYKHDKKLLSGRISSNFTANYVFKSTQNPNSGKHKSHLFLTSCCHFVWNKKADGETGLCYCTLQSACKWFLMDRLHLTEPQLWYWLKVFFSSCLISYFVFNRAMFRMIHILHGLEVSTALLCIQSNQQHWKSTQNIQIQTGGKKKKCEMSTFSDSKCQNANCNTVL